MRIYTSSVAKWLKICRDMLHLEVLTFELIGSSVLFHYKLQAPAKEYIWITSNQDGQILIYLLS